MSAPSDAGPSTRRDGSPRGTRAARTGTWRDDRTPPRETDLEEVWSQRNLLSLDGGGIRGYWTLLVLKRLMKAIADEERRQGRLTQKEFHSFFPEDLPDHVTQGPFKSQEEREMRHARDEGYPRCDGLRDARKFLPCHYFDTICGTSTGSLIAIMLARFRMTVQDCLHEYEQMGHVVFGKPRLVSQRNLGIVLWPKYSARAMGKAFKDVTTRRCEKFSSENQYPFNVRFPTIPAVCNTFVTTYKLTKGSETSSETLYLIRSYDHLERKINGSTLLRRNTGFVKNHGKADSLEIWEVARAATAAPMYFKPIKFKRANPNGATKVYFSDGGFGHTNNPTQLGIQEIESRCGSTHVGVVVSVGTARADDEPGGKSIFKRVKKSFSTATDPRIVAEQLADRGLYWRFNDDMGLKVELDEWKPNRETLKNIENEFNRWIKRRSILRNLEECARELVRRRRRRADDASRWERYATAAQFRCQHHACSNRLFDFRAEFEEHWNREHAHEEDQDEAREPAVEMWRYQRDYTTPRTMS